MLVRTGLLVIVATSLGCAGGGFLGYTTHGLYPEHIRTVGVPVFKNESLRRDVELQLTQEVIKELERVGYKVVDADKADIEVLGTIVADDKMGVGHDGFINPRGGLMNLVARVRVIDKLSGKNLAEGDVTIDPTPVALQSQETFLIDIVQSRASAEQRALREMARNVVVLLQNPW
jgi:hypothetical protein